MQLKMDRNSSHSNQILQFVCFVYLLSLSTLFINCHEESRCDFQTRECDWKLSSNWKWKPISHDQRSLQLNSTPSIKDNGYELENHLNGGEYMESPELFPESESENFCFIFDYYFMNDGRHDDQNYLALYLLKFIADSDGGLMAVKNFRLIFDHCQNNVGICDFETSICGWKSSWEGGITIRRKLASHTSSPKGIDHTTLTSDGHVLYGKYSNPRSDQKQL
ncbi:hypothetical protein DERP_013091 [Dermatophagoides pteronyssinus]|uniref:MAM domain-containing protein n=1 Tax=Dermatophagoides pteronyssinus TaxID=6956 RepID=A0ABQ8J5M4_DERPT|nr:hypothetical protein DERP_013091 [Dermatophagoides pteronyssinus]